MVVPFPIACGHCFFCEHQLSPHCENSNPNYGPEGGLLTEKGAALFSYTDLNGGYSGGQAQNVRVPYAHLGPRKIETSLRDEQVLFLTDIFPTGWGAVAWGELKGGEAPVHRYIDELLTLVKEKKVFLNDIITHTLPLQRAAEAYHLFNAKEDNCLKVVQKPHG